MRGSTHIGPISSHNNNSHHRSGPPPHNGMHSNNFSVSYGGHRPPPPPISGMSSSHSYQGQPSMSSMHHRNPPPPISGMGSSYSRPVHDPLSSMLHQNPPPPISLGGRYHPINTVGPAFPSAIFSSTPVIASIPPTGNRPPFGGGRTLIVPQSLPSTTTVFLSSSSPAPVVYQRPSMFWSFLSLSGTALFSLFALTHGWGPLALAGIIGLGSYALYKSNQSSPPANNPAPSGPRNTENIAQNLDGGRGLTNGVQYQPNLDQSQVPPSSSSASQYDAPPPDYQSTYQSNEGFTSLQSSDYVPTPPSAPSQYNY